MIGLILVMIAGFGLVPGVIFANMPNVLFWPAFGLLLADLRR